VLDLKGEAGEIEDVSIEGIPLVSDLAPLLKTRICRLRLPDALTRQITIDPWEKLDASAKEKLAKIRGVELTFEPEGEDLVFSGKAFLDF
jgi:hypothetical protein